MKCREPSITFSSPFVRGTVSLLVDLEPRCGEAQTADAISHAQWLGENMGKGLDIESALAAFVGIKTYWLLCRYQPCDG
jgi:hypothetical protein